MNNAMIFIALIIMTLFASLLLIDIDANAMAMVSSKKLNFSTTEKIEATPSIKKQIKSFICQEIDCPDHISVDEFKTSGSQLAEIHVHLNYQF